MLQVQATVLLKNLVEHSCADPESFVRGSKFDNAFCLFLVCLLLVDEGIDNPNVTINGSS